MSVTHCVHSNFARRWSSLPGLRGAKHIVGSDNKPAFQVSLVLRGLLRCARVFARLVLAYDGSVVVRWHLRLEWQC